jgi:hypothetical protein
MSEIIQNLNSFAEKAVQSNNPTDWSNLSNQIAKIYNVMDKPFDFKNYKREIEIKPYNFNKLNCEDFSSDYKEQLDEIKELINLKIQLVREQKYEDVATLRKKELELVDAYIKKICYKFSDNTFFKKNTDGVYQHLFYFRFK